MLQNTPHGNIFVSVGRPNTQFSEYISIIQNPNSEDFAYFDWDVYDLSEIYDAPYSPVGPYPCISNCFNNTVEAWLYSDNEITTYKPAIAKQKQDNLFYPNPSNGIIMLEESYSQTMQINIYNLTGKLVFNKEFSANYNREINLQDSTVPTSFPYFLINSKK